MPTEIYDPIIQLGASLSLQTTAEGIETSSSLDWLSDQGCNFGQGYLFGAPMPKDAADRFLESGAAEDLAARRAVTDAAA